MTEIIHFLIHITYFFDDLLTVSLFYCQEILILILLFLVFIDLSQYFRWQILSLLCQSWWSDFRNWFGCIRGLICVMIWINNNWIWFWLNICDVNLSNWSIWSFCMTFCCVHICDSPNHLILSFFVSRWTNNVSNHICLLIIIWDVTLSWIFKCDKTLWSWIRWYNISSRIPINYLVVLFNLFNL